MTSPLDIIAAADRAYPVTRIVWPAIAVVGAVAVLESFKLGWNVAFLGGIAVLLLLILFFLVAALVKIMDDDFERRQLLRYPASVIVWAFTLSICMILGLTLSSFFFDYPKTTAELFTFGRTVVVAEQQKPTQTSPIIQPLPSTPSSPANGTTGQLQTADAATVNHCLDGIDKTKYSAAKVERLARQCIKPQ